jgi:hypothetical protein
MTMIMSWIKRGIKSDMTTGKTRGMNVTIAKKIHFSRFTLAALVLTVAVVLAGGTGADADRGQFAVLVRARGEVLYQPSGTTKWVGASERMRLNQGDVLKTGANGEAVLKLSDRNFVDIRSNSQMTLSQAQVRSVPDPNNRVFGLIPGRQRVLDAEVDLARGRAVSVMRGLQGSSNYRLRTPIATAGVRGTVFLAEVIPAGSDRGVKQGTANTQVNFACSEGSLNINPTVPGQFSPLILNQGQFFSAVGTPGGDVIGTPSTAPIPEFQSQTISHTAGEVENIENPPEVDRTQDPEFPSTKYDSNYWY